MAETEQLSPRVVTEAAVAGTPKHMARLVRLWAGLIVVLTLVNLGLYVWYVASTGDFRTFLSHQFMTPFLSVVYAGLGVAVTTRRPHNPIGPIFLGVASSYTLSALAAGMLLYHVILPAAVTPVLLDVAMWLSNWAWLPAQLLPMTFVFLLFPDGHLPSRRWWPVGWASGLSLLLLMLTLAAHPGPVSTWGTKPNPFGLPGAERILWAAITIGSVLLAVGVFGSMAAVVVRFRRSRGIERAQMKWLVYAAAVVLSVGVFTVPLWFSNSLSDPLSMEVSIALTNLVTLGIAAAATIAIVRYRLYDIDILINRTLVYVLMTGAILLIYSLSVGAAGVLFGSRFNWLPALLATGLVAVLFQPLRSRLQRGVNRLLYGRRDEPFEVLAQLGQRLEQTMTAEAVYPTIVETVAQSLRLPYVALQVCRGDSFQTVESLGRSGGEPLALPLMHQGESVGRLLVGRRAADEPLSPADEHLLRNIARQAGVAVYNVQLTADLRRSRQQIVTGREEERRRLRRDLHDGLGPSLASLLLEARVLRRMIRDDPAAAESLAEEMQADIRATIDDIRRVVHELRPPALDDLGLVPALNLLAAKIGRPEAGGAAGLEVQVDAPDALPPLPAAVEVAAYRIVQEALTNVVHHARARRAMVCLRLDHALTIEISDDGRGFQQGRVGGLGLNSMRERAAELGGSLTVRGLPAGGTLVRAALPLEGA